MSEDARMRPLLDAVRRLQRAEVHLDALHELIGRQAETCSATHTRNGRRLIWRLDVTESVEIPLVASDAIHQIRSGLDNAVWALLASAQASKPVLRECYFPLCSEDHEYLPNCDAKPRARERIGQLPAEALAVIDSVQPFRADSPADHPLTHLRLLSNRDKHSALRPAYSAVVGSGFSVHAEDGYHPVFVRDAAGVRRSPVNTTPGPVRPGDQIAWMDLPDVDFDVPGRVGLVYTVIFGQEIPSLLGRPFFETILLAHAAAKDVIEQLDALYS